MNQLGPGIPDSASLATHIEAKLDQFAAASAVGPWRFHVYLPGEAPAEAPQSSFDDSGWEEAALPRTWSSLDGEGWFRTSIDLPGEVQGVSLAGSKLELDIFLTIGATVYVNGIQCYREPSWADSRAVPLLLSESLRPGQPVTLAVRCNAGDGFALFALAALRISALAEAVYRLDLLRSQLAFTRFLMDRQVRKGAPDAARLSAWQSGVALLDVSALDANDWPRWYTSVDAALSALAPFRAEAKQFTAHLVAHSHIDMNWLWPMQETIDVCQRDFAAMDQLMARYPEFRFSQSQAATYSLTEQRDPGLFERVRERVAGGKWDVTAATWVEGDLNLSSGEAQARQLLHARRYIRDRFGMAPVICWEPDTFGHTATFPQLLARSGVKFYYFCRAGKRHPLFWWEAPDGSRVLAAQDLRGYNGVVTPGNVAGCVMDFAAPHGLQRGLYVYGVGDHGGSGTARDVEAARRIDAEPLMPRALPSSTVAFFEAALADLTASAEGSATDDLGLPVVRDELNTVFEGCYTSHGDIKRLNREAENALLSGEAVATVAASAAGAAYPAAELAEAWRTACFHQFHDILCGCAISVTYREAHERLREAIGTAKQVTASALSALAQAMDTGVGAGKYTVSKGVRIVVFNPLAWARSDLVRVPLSALGGARVKVVVDDAGQHHPAQVSGDELVFVAAGVPALGGRFYRLMPEGEVAAGEVSTNSSTFTLENGLLRLRVHPESGALVQLLDLEQGRDLAGAWGGWGPEAKSSSGMLNRLQVLWEQPHPMSAWNIGDISRVDHLVKGADVRVLESGPVRGVIEVRRRFLKSSLVQRIALYRGLRRIDFETEVEWHERGNAHEDAPMLRASFGAALGSSRATFEVPFAGLERVADGREVPAQRWADLSELAGQRRSGASGYGLSLLTDCKYGFQAQGNTLGLTLLRASYEPDVNPDEGTHRFTYALYPHAGDWREAGTLEQAAQLNQPLLAMVTDGHRGRLQPCRPFLSCESRKRGGAVVVSALKLAEDQPASGKALIARVFEAHGQPAQATLRLSQRIATVETVSITEESLSSDSAGELAVSFTHRGTVRLRLEPYEIKTVKIVLA